MCIIRGEAWFSSCLDVERLCMAAVGCTEVFFIGGKESSSGQRLQFGYLLRAIYRTEGARYVIQVGNYLPCKEVYPSAEHFSRATSKKFAQKNFENFGQLGFLQV